MQNTYSSTGTQKICTVMAVDIVRKVCKCLSDSGEILSEVKWVVPMGGTDGNGMSVHPVENSRVLVDTASGFPFIVGAIPSDGSNEIRRTNIGRQDVDEEDIADYSTVEMGDIIRGPGTPRDQRPGDSMFTADGGGILGLLQSGTGIIKSSPLAQIITSRFGDLVRVVARNYERFSDVDEEYKASIRGKVFGLRNVFRTPEESRAGTPSFSRMEGNIPTAEAAGKDYAGFTAGDFPGADADDIVNKENTYSGNSITSTWTQSIDGTQTWDIGPGSITIVMDAAGSITTEITGEFKIKAADTTFDLANLTFNTSGTTTFNSGGNIVATAPTIQLN